LAEFGAMHGPIPQGRGESKPPEIHCYFDKLRLWLITPLNDREHKQLEAECRGRVERFDTPAIFHPKYRQEIQVYQPYPKALHMLTYLGDRDGAMLVSAELARDLSPIPDRLMEFVKRAVRHAYAEPYHRSTTPTKSFPHGFSTRDAASRKDKRRRGKWSTWYTDDPDRFDGVSPCLHFEVKVEGASALRRVGLNHPRDLVGFDFESFFARHLTLYAIDFKRLGRFHRNRRSGSKRQKPERWDGRLGYSLWWIHSRIKHTDDHLLQQFLDSYGKGPFLVPLSITYVGTISVMLEVPVLAQQILSLFLPESVKLARSPMSHASRSARRPLSHVSR
jgi:hypothetical protein